MFELEANYYGNTLYCVFINFCEKYQRLASFSSRGHDAKNGGWGLAAPKVVELWVLAVGVAALSGMVTPTEMKKWGIVP